jgi:hypothetical protein
MFALLIGCVACGGEDDGGGNGGGGGRDGCDGVDCPPHPAPIPVTPVYPLRCRSLAVRAASDDGEFAYECDWDATKLYLTCDRLEGGQITHRETTVFDTLTDVIDEGNFGIVRRSLVVSNNAITRFTYDEWNNWVREYHSAVNIEFFAWDDLGRPLEGAVQQAGCLYPITVEYDSAHRKIRRTHWVSKAEPIGEVGIEPDADDNDDDDDEDDRTEDPGVFLPSPRCEGLDRRDVVETTVVDMDGNLVEHSRLEFAKSAPLVRYKYSVLETVEVCEGRVTNNEFRRRDIIAPIFLPMRTTHE